MNKFFYLSLFLTSSVFAADHLPYGLLSYKQNGYIKIQVRAQEEEILPESGEHLNEWNTPRGKNGRRFNLEKKHTLPHIPWENKEFAIEELNPISASSMDESIAGPGLKVEDGDFFAFYRPHYFCSACCTYIIDGECGYELKAVPEDGLSCEIFLIQRYFFPPLARSHTRMSPLFMEPATKSPQSTVSVSSESIEADEQNSSPSRAATFHQSPMKSGKGRRRQNRQRKQKNIIFHIG
ncbi:hypothetical protein FJ366_01510 [Candidatus Dependentiae bacterium]|nr:hypothetical protein [Candidatus Dependentiae bacterium]